MRTFPTLEEMKGMTIGELKALDIMSKEEEDNVQKILTLKMKDAPVPQQVFRGDVPDIKTKEEELRWQAIIDKREASLRPGDHVQETEVDLDKMPPVINAPVEVVDDEIDPPGADDELVDDTDPEADEIPGGELADEEEVVATEPVKTEAELEAEIAALENNKADLLAS